jgi:hypothetical protein
MEMLMTTTTTTMTTTTKTMKTHTNGDAVACRELREHLSFMTVARTVTALNSLRPHTSPVRRPSISSNHPAKPAPTVVKLNVRVPSRHDNVNDEDDDEEDDNDDDGDDSDKNSGSHKTEIRERLNNNNTFR